MDNLNGVLSGEEVVQFLDVAVLVMYSTDGNYISASGNYYTKTGGIR